MIPTSPLWKVGEKTRITLAPGKTCRCLVLCVGLSDEHEPIYDVLLAERGSTSSTSATATMGTSRRVESHESTEVPVDDGEISGVRDKDLVALQSFELDGSLENSSEKLKGDLDPEELQSQAEDLKDKGNTLFKLGDMEAAAEVFGRVLLALEPPPGVGTGVMVKPATVSTDTAFRYRSAMVSDATHEGVIPTYGIIYDEEDDEGEDEEDGVTGERVATMPRGAPCVACAARLNLARCKFKESKHAEVVDACTLVLGMCRLLMANKDRSRDERAKLRGHSLTALRMRGGSHLAQNHINLARKDARTMARSAGDDETRAQATRFEAEVEKKSKSLIKANRKLAKDVLRWTNTSMAKLEEASSSMRDAGSEPDYAEHAEEGGVDGETVESKGIDAGDVGRSTGGGISSWLGNWLR